MSYQNTIAALAALSVLLLPVDAPAANRNQTTDELTAEAELVVLGTVRVKNSRWGDDSRIYTDVLISSEVTLKGQDQGAVSVEVLGGTIGDVSMAVSDGAEFAEGERVLVFLKRHGNLFQVAGREAGKHAAGSPNAVHVLERVLDRLEKDSKQKIHPRRGLAEAFLKKATSTASNGLTTGTTTTTASTACYLTDGTKWARPRQSTRLAPLFRWHGARASTLLRAPGMVRGQRSNSQTIRIPPMNCPWWI
jgi:hypothetical protein